jgi:hypothetical protein
MRLRRPSLFKECPFTNKHFNGAKDSYLLYRCYWYANVSLNHLNSLTDSESLAPALLTPGYIGGSVLQRLLNHTKRDTFEITALVRSADKATVLNTIGVNTVIASLFDFDKVAELSGNSNVVINTVIRHLIRVRTDVVLNLMHRLIQTA